jgi:hypothetical protein
MQSDRIGALKNSLHCVLDVEFDEDRESRKKRFRTGELGCAAAPGNKSSAQRKNFPWRRWEESTEVLPV